MSPRLIEWLHKEICWKSFSCKLFLFFFLFSFPEFWRYCSFASLSTIWLLKSTSLVKFPVFSSLEGDRLFFIPMHEFHSDLPQGDFLFIFILGNWWALEILELPSVWKNFLELLCDIFCGYFLSLSRFHGTSGSFIYLSFLPLSVFSL